VTKKGILFVLSFLWASSFTFSQASNRPSTFTIAGSGSNISLTQMLLNAYGEKTGVHIRIPPSIGTTGAVKAIKANALTLGLASRPLKESEKEPNLKELPYARLGIIVGVHSDVPDQDIAFQDLVSIFAGTKKTWSNGKMIIVLAREPGDSSNIVFERIVPGFKEVLSDALNKKRWDIFYTDQDEFEAIRNTKNAIGFVDTASIRDLAPAVKATRVNGVEPSLENVENGSYPFWKDLSFFYYEPLAPEAGAFIDFVFSQEGIAILRKGGAILPPESSPR